VGSTEATRPRGRQGELHAFHLLLAQRMTYSTVPLSSTTDLGPPASRVMHDGVITALASAPLADLANTMSVRRVHAVLVCDPAGVPEGWVTTRGMLHNLPRDWVGASAADAITEPVISVPPAADMHAVLQAFLASGASHILVRAADDEPVLGVIAESDLLGALVVDVTPDERHPVGKL
jgi:CBS-domain-containing membrane protein